MSKALTLSTVEKFVPVAARKGVSEVARSSRGFVQAYRRAGGKLSAMSPEWQARRDAFIKRHRAQVTLRKEALFDKHGEPSRRHLALIMWAYSPQPSKLKAAPKDNPVVVGTHPDFFVATGDETPVHGPEGGDWRAARIEDITVSVEEADLLNEEVAEIKNVLAEIDEHRVRNARGVAAWGKRADLVENLREQGLNDDLIEDMLDVEGEKSQDLRAAVSRVVNVWSNDLAAFFSTVVDDYMSNYDYRELEDKIPLREAHRAIQKFAEDHDFDDVDVSNILQRYSYGELFTVESGESEGPFEFWEDFEGEDIEVSAEDVKEAAPDVPFENLGEDVWEEVSEKVNFENVVVRMLDDGNFRVSLKVYWRAVLNEAELLDILERESGGAMETFDDMEIKGADAFWAWFGNSVVVDEDDKPKVCYHGTKKGGFTIFSKSKIDAHHAGFFFSDKQAVSRTYTSSTNDPIWNVLGVRKSDVGLEETRETARDPEAGIYRVFLRIENPLVVDANGNQWNRIKYDPARLKVKASDFMRDLLAIYTAALSPPKNKRPVVADKFRDDVRNVGTEGLQAVYFVTKGPDKLTHAEALKYVKAVVEAYLENESANLQKRVENWGPHKTSARLEELLKAAWELLPEKDSVRNLVYCQINDVLKLPFGADLPDEELAEAEERVKEAAAEVWKLYPAYRKALKIKNETFTSMPGYIAESEVYTKTDLLAHFAKDNGYDGLIVNNVHDSGGESGADPIGTVYVVFDPNQVKSARNVGTWSRTDNDIRRNPSRSPTRRRRRK